MKITRNDSRHGKQADFPFSAADGTFLKVRFDELSEAGTRARPKWMGTRDLNDKSHF
jgi:hypothetical protein